MSELEQRREEIEILAEKLLKDNYMFKIPINPMTLTKLSGFKVYLVSFNKPNIFGGLSIKNKVVSFYINDKEELEQKRYILAHLLGTYYLHNKDKEEVSKLISEVDLLRGLKKDDYNTYREETEANMFADAFLVPSELVEKAINLLGSNQLGKHFELSDDIINRRLSQIETD